MNSLLEKLKAKDKKLLISAIVAVVAVIAIVVVILVSSGGDNGASGDSSDINSNLSETGNASSGSLSEDSSATDNSSETDNSSSEDSSEVENSSEIEDDSSAVDSSVPDEESSKPDESSKPNEESSVPDESSKYEESSKPDEESSQPDESSKPDEESSKPDEESSDTSSENSGDTSSGSSEEILGKGSESDPYLEIPNTDTMTLTTVSIPAGKSLFYGIYRVGGMYLTIESSDAYVVYDGTRYDAENGKVSFEVANAMPGEPVMFEIGNKSSSAKTFELKFVNLKGSQANPAVLESLEETTISLEAGNEVGYFYTYTAEKSGTLRFYMSATEDSVMSITRVRGDIPVQKTITNTDNSDNSDVLTDENGLEYIEFEVASGDVININVGAIPSRRGKVPATDITFSGEFN